MNAGFICIGSLDVEKSSDTPDENRTPSASVSPESTLTASPVDNNNENSISIGDICLSRPQSLQFGQNGTTTTSVFQTNVMCDKEQQTPQDPHPPFFIPPPLLPPELIESSSDLDSKVNWERTSSRIKHIDNINGNK